MIKVLLVASDDAVAGRLTEAIGPSYVRVAPQPLPVEPDVLFAGIALDALPHIVVLDGSGRENAALELSSRLTARGVATILLSPDAEALALPALRAGVRDLVPPSAAPADLRAALDRTALALQASAPAPIATGAGKGQGRVVAVISPKGGVGKTTTSTNLAVGLAMKAPGSTVLVDVDLHFGDVASALDLSPTYTLPDVALGASMRDSLAVKSVLTQHRSGLLVVPGSDSPAAADAVTADDIRQLLSLLRQQFQYVVVDTAPGLSDHTLAVLDEAETLVMVTSLDVPGVRGMRKEIDTLAELGLLAPRRFVVLNFVDDSRGLTLADVQATIKAKVDVVVPLAKEVPLSVNRGVPLVEQGGRDPVTVKFRTLVDLVAPGDWPTPSKKGLLARRAV